MSLEAVVRNAPILSVLAAPPAFFFATSTASRADYGEAGKLTAEQLTGLQLIATTKATPTIQNI
jgi:hypothetical protein